MSFRLLLLAMMVIFSSCQARVETPPGLDPWALATSVVQPQQPVVPEEIAEGRRVFLENSCVMCHSIRGTQARASVGPDLTHLASRKTIASGSFPNTRGQLAAWILNPQNLKQGTQMPPTVLTAKDLHSLLLFLESLQ